MNICKGWFNRNLVPWIELDGCVHRREQPLSKGILLFSLLARFRFYLDSICITVGGKINVKHKQNNTIKGQKEAIG